MAHPDIDEHGPGRLLARSEVGSVSTCSCGVITLTLQYLSLRFEPGAFRELQDLLALAQHRLDQEIGRDGRDAGSSPAAEARDDVPNVH